MNVVKNLQIMNNIKTNKQKTTTTKNKTKQNEFFKTSTVVCFSVNEGVHFMLRISISKMSSALGVIVMRCQGN